MTSTSTLHRAALTAALADREINIRDLSARTRSLMLTYMRSTLDEFPESEPDVLADAACDAYETDTL